MRITLTDDEVRAALFEAVLEKTSHVLQQPDFDGCHYFTITSAGSEVHDIESVEYTVIFGDDPS